MTTEGRDTPIPPRHRDDRPTARRLRSGRHARHDHLASDTVASAGIQALRLFASLATLLAFKNVLGYSEYGRFAGVQGVVSLSTLLGCFWLPQLVLQRVLRDDVDLASMGARAITLAAVGGAAAIAVTCAIGAFLPVPFVAVVCLIVAEVTAATLVETSASLYQVQHGFAAATRIRMLTPTCRLIAVGITLVTRIETLQRFALLVVATLVPTAIVAAVGTMRELGLHLRFGPLKRSDVVNGMSYSSIGGFYAMQDDGDKTLLLANGYDVGFYAAAYRVLQIAMFPITAFVIATHPRFLRFSETDGPEERRRRAIRFALPTLGYALVAALCVFLVRRPIASLLGVGVQHADVLAWLCLLLPLRSTTEFALNGLLGLGRNWLRVVLVAISAAVNIAVNIAFIPAYSWKAAAVSTLIADGLLAVIAWSSLWWLGSGRDLPDLRELRRASVRGGGHISGS